ncbi:hypothetical protein [Pseudomonas sp. B392_1p]|uniref:hypothetical protein n=1 Tax=Pseudomonas sp. B392_1p TaxID=3457507 RepID=UPI003FD27E9A
MNTLTLSADARSQLAEQISQDGTFIHGLCNSQGLTVALAYVVIEQCGAAIQVRIELGETRNSLTLARCEATATCVACFIEKLANGGSPSTVADVDQYLQVGDLEALLREAIRVGQGTYCLPAGDTDLGLYLMLSPARSDHRRVAFRFELNDENLTLPLLLPTNPQLAYELLESCVHELLVNYRSSAA